MTTKESREKTVLEYLFKFRNILHLLERRPEVFFSNFRLRRRAHSGQFFPKLLVERPSILRLARRVSAFEFGRGTRRRRMFWFPAGQRRRRRTRKYRQRDTTALTCQPSAASPAMTGRRAPFRCRFAPHRGLEIPRTGEDLLSARMPRSWRRSSGKRSRRPRQPSP